MASRQASPTVLLILLCVAVFLVNLAVLMLGPLLVALAHAFQTSVAIVGQLAAATAITWGIVAPLAGPLSDAYGRRHILLSGLLLMAGAAWLRPGVALQCSADLPPPHWGGCGDRHSHEHRRACGGLSTDWARHGDWLVAQCHGRQCGSGGAARGLLAGCWGVATPLCRDRYSIAGHRDPLMALVPAPSAAVWPGPRVLLLLSGGRLPGHGLVRAGRQRVPANGLFWDVWLPGGLSHADLPSAHRSHRAPPGSGGDGRHGGQHPGRTGCGPSPPYSLVRPVVLGERLPGGPGLHGAGVTVGHWGLGVWYGRAGQHIVRGDPDVVAGAGGERPDHRHGVVYPEQPTGRVRRHSAGRTDARVGRIPAGGIFLSGGDGPRGGGDPPQGQRLGRIAGAAGPTEGHNCHRIERRGCTMRRSVSEPAPHTCEAGTVATR